MTFMTNYLRSATEFFRRYEEAAWNKNVNAMIELYDDDIVVFDMWGKGFINGREEWAGVISDWLTSLKDEKVKVTFDMTEIEESEHVAFASTLVQFQAIADDERILRSMRNRMSVGFVKRNGSWKVKHQHTSAPIDSELKGILDI